MKTGRKDRKASRRDDPAVTTEEPAGDGDPFADFLQDFYGDPQKPLKFLRSFMAGEEAYSPSVDVVEERDKLTVIVDLPGVEQDDFKVEFVEGGVLLKGRRSPAPEPEGSRLRRAERPAGEFTKSVPLPKGLDVRAVVAKVENGVLTLTIPRASYGSDWKRLTNGD